VTTRKESLPARRWRAGAAWVIAVSAALALSACGSSASSSSSSSSAAAAGSAPASGGSLVSQAKQEGQVSLYWAVDSVTGQNVANAFKAAYGITVNFDRIPDSGTLRTRYFAEAAAGAPGADIVITTDTPTLETAVQKGYMLPVSQWGVSDISSVPQAFVADDFVTAGLFTLNNVFINTNNVKPSEYPTTWQDLAKPMWKGQLISDDPRLVDTTMSIFAELDHLYGDSYIKALGQQNLTYVQSLVSGAQTVAAGEKLGAFGIGQIHINPLLQSAPNAPVKLIKLSGPVFGAEWDVGLSAKAKDPAAAKLFISWLFSAAGQQVFNKIIGPSVLPGVSIPGFPPLGSDYARLPPVDSAGQAKLLGLLGLGS
jgi:iron(III) transport system substrate-binding protein